MRRAVLLDQCARQWPREFGFGWFRRDDCVGRQGQNQKELLLAFDRSALLGDPDPVLV